MKAAPPLMPLGQIALKKFIVLATPATVFQDKPHFDFGIVPGDGVNLLWPEVIGSVPRPLLYSNPPRTQSRDGQGMGRGQRDRTG
jgi:hypothetical protein